MSNNLITRSKRSFAILALLLTMVTTGLAQTTSGSAAVTTVDPNGDAVAGASITIENKDTGASFTGETSDIGQFRFPSLAPGPYTMTINASSFSPQTTDIQVLLNRETSITVNLTVGVAGETVDITAGEEAVVQTTTSQLGASFSTTQISELPINGNQNALALLAPGVVTQGGGTLGSGGSVGGARARSNSFNVDGVDNNDSSVTGPRTTIIQDAIAEFTLLQNNFSAEYGSAAAGQFNTITKSGTNELHGSAFYYVQNKNLNARTSAELDEAFVDENGMILDKPRFDLNRIGGTVGGPVIKDKLFFFGAYEHTGVGSAATATPFFAPTAEGIAILSGLSGISPTTLGILKLVQTAAVAEDVTVVNGRNIPVGSVFVTPPSFQDQHLYQINMDWNIRQEDQLRGRYANDRFRASNEGQGAAVIFDAASLVDSQLISITEVHTFSPTVVNELRISYRHSVEDFPLTNPEFQDLPNFTILDLGLVIGPAGNLPQSGEDWNYQLLDSVSWSTGAHTFKFGGELRNLLTNSNFLQRQRGDYFYTSLEPFLQDLVPDDFALRGVGTPTFTGSNWSVALYAQDDWKVTQNLTLNLGLRYDYASVARDAKLQALNSIASAPGVVEFVEPQPDKTDFAPRIGFAYAPAYEDGFLHTFFGNPGQSSIRGGFGIAYDKIFQNLLILQLPPQFNSLVTNDQVGANQEPFIEGGGIPNTLPQANTVASARQLTASILEPSPTSPYTMSWSLGFQREITPSMGIEVRYQGSRGVHLPVQQQLNSFIQPTGGNQIPTFFSTPSASQLRNLPTFAQLAAAFPRVRRLNAMLQPGEPLFAGAITQFSTIGNSFYHAGSVSLSRRLSKGLAMTAAYTYSSLIDDSTNELNSSAINPRRPQDAQNISDERGRSVLDHPHRFVSSFVYELPFFNDSQGLTRTLLGGFEVAGIVQFESGQPFTPLSFLDANRNGDTAGDRTFVNQGGVEGTGSGITAVTATGATVAVGSGSAVAYVVKNPNAQFIAVGPLSSLRPNAGRNTERTNTLKNLDLTLLKNFRFGEDYNIQFGAEMFNATNTQNLIVTDTLATSQSFPNVGSALFNDYRNNGVYGGRTIQLRLKFIF